MKITYTQLVIASALGLRFTHGWAQYRDHLLDYFKYSKIIDLDDLQKQLFLLAAISVNNQNGIKVNAQGAVVHESESNRIHWSITPQGQTTIQVLREQQWVLSATIDYRLCQQTLMDIVCNDLSNLQVEPRHKKALAEAVLAVLKLNNGPVLQAIDQIMEYDESIALAACQVEVDWLFRHYPTDAKQRVWPLRKRLDLLRKARQETTTEQP